MIIPKSMQGLHKRSSFKTVVAREKKKQKQKQKIATKLSKILLATNLEVQINIYVAKAVNIFHVF